MHALILRTEILLASLLIARGAGAVHQLIPTILVRMGLDMAPRNNLFATLRREWTPHGNLIAHIRQESRDIQVDISCRGSTRRTCEVVSTRGEAPNRGIQAGLAEYMIAFKAHGPDKWTVTDRTHKVVVIAGDVLERAQVKDLILLAACLHGEELVKLHAGSEEDAACKDRIISGQQWLPL